MFLTAFNLKLVLILLTLLMFVGQVGFIKNKVHIFPVK